MKESVTMEILTGKFSMPTMFHKHTAEYVSIKLNRSYNDIYNVIEDKYLSIMNRMWDSLWYHFMKNKGATSLLYWADQFDNHLVFNAFVHHLTQSKWCVTNIQPARNWAEISLNQDKLLDYISPDQLQQLRAHKKFVQYLPTATISTKTDLVKLNGKVQRTGIIREGFAKAGNSRYTYDTNIIKQYYEPIVLNITKAMDKLPLDDKILEDKAGYRQISIDILDYIISASTQEYTVGNNISDSRGRAIKEALKKVFNPISSKDARALIVLPLEHSSVLTYEGLEAVYLFIAELLGIKAKSKSDKIRAGRLAYIRHDYNELDLTTESGRKHMYENLWLERVYNELDETFNVLGRSTLDSLYDKYFDDKATPVEEQEKVLLARTKHIWRVPIELDATALNTSAH